MATVAKTIRWQLSLNKRRRLSARSKDRGGSICRLAVIVESADSHPLSHSVLQGIHNAIRIISKADSGFSDDLSVPRYLAPSPLVPSLIDFPYAIGPVVSIYPMRYRAFPRRHHTGPNRHSRMWEMPRTEEVLQCAVPDISRLQEWMGDAEKKEPVTCGHSRHPPTHVGQRQITMG